MSKEEVKVRRAEAHDESAWRVLWDEYNRFYGREPREEVTRYTWKRVLDPACPVHSLVAEADGKVMGIANYVIHENTSQMLPSCFLQDMIVADEARGCGVGRKLIEWLLAEMRTQGWSRVYWNTKENNYRARFLYDKFTPHSGFVRYVVNNPECKF